MFNLLKKLFSRNHQTQDAPLGPESIETLPAADDATFYRDSKKLLQRFDEYITAAEAESETLSIELDDTLEQQELIKEQLKRLNKPDSWHERHLLLKLDRLTVHGNNLKKRVEIYSQNIKVYLNLISKLEEIKAMRMNGLDESKIEAIWLEFKETLDEYKKRVGTEEAGFHEEPVLTNQQEVRLAELRKEVFPEQAQDELDEDDLDSEVPDKTKRRDLDSVLEERVKKEKLSERMME